MKAVVSAQQGVEGGFDGGRLLGGDLGVEQAVLVGPSLGLVRPHFSLLVGLVADQHHHRTAARLGVDVPQPLLCS